MIRRLTLYGVAGWIIGTIALRAGGQYLLRTHDWAGTLVLFAISFPVMAILMRRLCSGLQLPRDQWLTGAVVVMLPTFLLDPFSSAFFPVVFPNMAPEVAGVFGGWMLWCCAGALLGAMTGRPGPA